MNRKRVLWILSDSKLPLDTEENSSIDILAISLPAMLALDKINIKYFVPETFLPHQEVYRDTIKFAKVLEEWLKECDDISLKEFNIERLFSANGFWFVHRLSDLRYIHQLLNKLIIEYDSIEILTSINLKESSSPKLNFEQLHLPFFGTSLDHLLKFLLEGSNKVTVSNFVNKKKYAFPLIGSPINHFIRRIPEIIKRKSLKFLKDKTIKHNIINQELLWVIQGGYEVEILKENSPEFVFKNPIINKKIIKKNKVSDETLFKINELSYSFFSKYLSGYESWLTKIIKSYTLEVLSRVDGLEKQISSRLHQEKPLGLLFSIGSETIYEETFARVAIKNNIPVYYFKHGGAENLFQKHSILDPFLEKNPYIKRVQFIQSKLELKEFDDMSLVQAINVGALYKYKKLLPKKNKSRILFSSGAPAHYSMKELRKICSDFERYQFCKNLFSICSSNKFDLDVKIHPVEWEIGYDFFKLLHESTPNSQEHINILIGGTIERILSQYKVIILDMVGSKVLSSALCLDISVILFVPPMFPLNEENFEDLDKRVHIVSNFNELEIAIKSLIENDEDKSSFYDFNKTYFGALEKDRAVSKIKEIINSDKQGI